MYGWYLFGKPILGINDIELVKIMKVKDFNHFVDVQDDHTSEKMQIGGEIDSMLNANMQNAKEGEWRDIRSAFSPIFTSGRMKGMMKYIKQVGMSLTEEIGRKAKAGKAV